MERYEGYEAIRFERLGDVLRVTLANPRNPVNAVDGETHAELMRLFDDLPRTGVGKVHRVKVRKMIAEEGGTAPRSGVVR